MRLMRRRQDSLGEERGAALAELAMVIPLMLLLMLVLYDFGQGFLAYVSVTNAARDAARVAMQEDVACTDAALGTTATNAAAPYTITISTSEDSGVCSVTVSHVYTPILPFVTSSFSLPQIGQVGPLWNGTMSETMKSRIS